MFVFLVLMLRLMLMLMRELEQHKTNKWVRSSYVSAYAYAYVAGVLTCYAYALVITSLKQGRWQRHRQRYNSMISLVESGKIIVLHVRHAF